MKHGLTVCFLCLAATITAAAYPVISEFQAANSTTLADEDGEFPDWIELHNPSATNIALDGWYLTDSRDDPGKWRVPAVTLLPGQFLVVFASGKDRTDPSSELHTNFKLDSSGEYLALVAPDGVSVAFAFDPAFPEQYADVSYGPAWPDALVTLLDTSAVCRVRVPTDATDGTNWTSRGFDDSSWTFGYTAVGFDRESGYENLVRTDVGGDMYNLNASVYVRVPFVVADAAEWASLELAMRIDDGFAAYLNGHPVAAFQEPDPLLWNSAATSTWPDANALVPMLFPIPDAAAVLVDGTNVLAIHGLNSRAGSSDLLVLPELSAVPAAGAFTGVARYFTVPTPGAVNDNAYAGVVADTTFSVDRGFFYEPFQVAITTETAEATIRYTLDGSAPSASHGTIYTNPVSVADTTILRATAYKPGHLSANVDSQTYLFPDRVLKQPAAPAGFPGAWVTRGGTSANADYEMDPEITNHPLYTNRMREALLSLPTLSLVTDSASLFDSQTGVYANPLEDGIAWERPASMEMIYPDGRDGFQADAGLRIYGGSSRNTDFPKKTLRLLFKSEYGDSRLREAFFKGDPFGDDAVDAFDTLILRGGHNNTWIHRHWFQAYRSQYIRDQWVRDAQLAMGSPSCHGTYVHLYVNGLYWGIYNPTERAAASFLASYYGGEKEHYDAQNVLLAIDGDLSGWNTLQSEADDSMSSNDEYEDIWPLLDLDQFIDYMLLNFYVGNDDWDGHNWYAGRRRSPPGPYRLFSWDAELSISRHVTSSPPPQPEYNTVLARNKSTLNGSNKPSHLFTRLRGNAEFRLRCADRIHRHLFNDGVLTPASCVARWRLRHDQIWRALPAEAARWGDYKRDVDSGKYTPEDYDLFHPDEHYLAHQEWILNGYFPRRHDIVLDQLRAIDCYPDVPAPVFARHGGVFTAGDTLAVTADDPVYVTTDGSDPRTYGTGAVAGTLYAAPLVLTRSTLVKARARRGSEWSALTEAVFVNAALPALRVTEIMYHPAPPQGTETNQGFRAQDFEFVELRNTGAAAVGLAGVAFTKGIHFDFTRGGLTALAPGEAALVVANRAAFTNRYTAWQDLEIAGEFQYPADSLSDDGEDLVLVDGLGRTILDFDYEDNWYAHTDGPGFSLVLRDGAPPDAMGRKTAWRASAFAGGSPGSLDPEVYPAEEVIVVNEVLAHQDHPGGDPGDWIELFNAGTEVVNLGGWYLGDSEADPARFRIADGTTLAPGGFVVFTEHDHFGTNAPGMAARGFALSELGGRVVLSSGTNDMLTGYRSVRFYDASARDLTLGRHVTTDGAVAFVALSSATPGATNALPRRDAVVISEIMYHPAALLPEYVELANSAETNVPLFDVSHPSNTCRLAGTIAYTFPTGTVLLAAERILVVPVEDSVFRLAYPGTLADTRVFGPFDGKLGNGGSCLRLVMPGAPDAESGAVPLVPLDAVCYDDKAPWPPEADGLGPSIERVALDRYGSQGSSWIAARPFGTPGAERGAAVLVSPAAGAAYFSPASPPLAVDVDALQADGSIEAVTFYQGTGETARVTAMPFHATAPVVTLPGTYSYSASFTDQAGTHGVPAVSVAVLDLRAHGARDVSDDSAVLTGAVTGPAGAAVTLYYGAADGGTNAAAWQHRVRLGTLTNRAVSVPVTLDDPALVYRLFAETRDDRTWTAPVAVPRAPVDAWPVGMRLQVSGYAGQDTLTNFPVLVRLGSHIPGFDYARFASASGHDLRFTSDDGTVALPYEFDHWTPGDTSAVWVRVPELTGTSTTFRAHWGMPSATNRLPCTTNGAVWAGGYKSVTHFEDSLAEATPARHAMVDAGSLDGVGVVGRGRRFDGAGYLDQVAVPETWYWLNMDHATVTVWMQPVADQLGTFWGTTATTSTLGLVVGSGRTPALRYRLGDREVSGCAVPAGQWYCVSMVLDGGEATGVCNDDSVSALGSYLPFVPKTRAFLGASCVDELPSDGVAVFVDEVRISSVARSVDWLTAAYRTVAANASFLTYGAVETTPDGDGDGMTDAWEELHFGGTNAPDGDAAADWDGDGAMNRDEFVAGTDPTNALSRFELHIGLGDDVTISFWTVPTDAWVSGHARLYSLQHRAQAAWSPVPGYTDVPATGGAVTYTNTTATNPPVLYRGRVRLEPTP